MSPSPEVEPRETHELYLPSAAAQDGSHVPSLEAYQALYGRSVAEPEAFWGDQARTSLEWFHPFSKVREFDWEWGQVQWFLNGRLNACHNCVDRHVADRGGQTALIWEADTPGEGRSVDYRELQREVCRLANVLRHHGIRKGDRVAIYMPMMLEAVYAMLACARIGAVHNVVFAGFSAESLRDRINDARCKAVVTADEGLRGGKVLPLKRTVDEAVMACPTVQFVFIVKRTGNKIPFYPQHDVWLREAMDGERPFCPIEHMDSEDTLFLLYTSGSTGKPKGVAHTTAGYLLQAALTHRYVFDYRPGDIFACVADIGWITGHSYVVYGPLCNGATTVLFESIPTYPDAGRYWDMVQRLRITQFYTAPTAIRAIAREGDAYVHRYDRSSLRVLGSVGRTDQPGSLALVPHGGRRGPLPGGGHLVADRDRRHPHQPAAGRHPAQARFRHPALLRGGAGGAGREGQSNCRATASPASWPSSTPGPAWPAPSRTTTSASWTPTCALPRLLHHRRRLPPGRGRLLLDHRPGGRRHQRLRPPPGHRRGGERPGHPSRPAPRRRWWATPTRSRARASSPTWCCMPGGRRARSSSASSRTKCATTSAPSPPRT